MGATFLALLSSFVDQFSTALIKKSENKKHNSISPWEAGFVSLIGSSIFIFIYGWKSLGGFALATISTLFWIRVVLEILQIFTTYQALKYSELSSFNFVRVFSIVFALLLELLLIGNKLSLFNYLGISLIICGVVFIYRHGFKNVKEWFYLGISTINGGVLNTLAKVQYNSGNVYEVESQIRLILILAIGFILLLTNKHKLEKRIEHNKEILFSIPFRAIASFLTVTAISMSTATSYVALERGGSVLFGVLLGHSIFKEKALLEKIFVSAIILAGIYFLYIN